MQVWLGNIVALFLAIIQLSSSVVAHGRAMSGSDCPERPDHEVLVRAYFGPLLERVGDPAGAPIGCLTDAADGGVSLNTTTGLLYARPEGGGPVRIVVFTDGHRHWAMDAGLSHVTLYWEGTAPYPPAAGVTRLPAARPGEPAPSSWPVTPAPTVGRPAPPAASAHRPETGEQFGPSTFGSGRSSLTIKNDAPQDVAVKIRDTDGARAARVFIYVRGGEQTKIEGVQPGSYQIQVATGSSWDTDSKIFSRGLLVFQFEEPVVFEETITETGISWWDRIFTLYRSGESNENVTEIAPSLFQQE